MNQQPVLYIREGELAGQSRAIEGESFLIGRGQSCDLTLPERQVSRHHAEISKQSGVYIKRQQPPQFMHKQPKLY